jgi:DnaK suppressor protein
VKAQTGKAKVATHATPKVAAKAQSASKAVAKSAAKSVVKAKAPVAKAKAVLAKAVIAKVVGKAVRGVAQAVKKPAVKAQAAKPKAKLVLSKPQTVAKSGAKSALKPVAKSVVKPVVKPATKSVAKPAAKPAAKPVAKTVAQSAAKPVAKPVSKPMPKATQPVAAKPVAVKAASPQIAKPEVVATSTKKAPPVSPVKSPAKSSAKTPAKSPEKAAVKAPVVAAVAAPVESRPIPMTSPPSPVRAGRPSSRLAQLTVPSMAQSVASTAAKSSFSKDVTVPHIVPPLASSVKKDPKLANNWKLKPLDQLTDADLIAMPDDAYMNDVQLAYFRRKLSVLKQEILSNAGETTEHLREDTVVVPDPADRATIEEEHALELRTRDRERKLLKKIEQSIGRIDAGDYGYCDETGEAIGVGRLLARPTATLSLEAQQRRELKQKMFGD